jgi:hypothetical protein
LNLSHVEPFAGTGLEKGVPGLVGKARSDGGVAKFVEAEVAGQKEEVVADRPASPIGATLPNANEGLWATSLPASRSFRDRPA